MDEVKEAVICILEILSNAETVEESIIDIDGNPVATQYVISVEEMAVCEDHLRKLQGRG